MSDDFIIHDKEDTHNFYDTELYQHYVKVLEGIDDIPINYLQAIYEKLPEELIETENFDEKFSLREELNIQMTLVRGLRKAIFNAKGEIRQGYDLDDAKQVLTASKDLVRILQTSQRELVNQDRMQAIELAFTDTIMELPQELRESYVEKLALYMEHHEPD